MDALSVRLHHDTGHCGGLVQHADEADFRQWMAKLKSPTPRQALMRKIDDAANVGAVMARLDPGRLLGMIKELSTSTPNRHYRSEAGVTASNAIAGQWRSIANGRDDIIVSKPPLKNAAQSTVIARIEGSERPSEIIVIGSHLDSTSSFAQNDPRGSAPGADDDASGVAAATEVLRDPARYRGRLRRPCEPCHQVCAAGHGVRGRTGRRLSWRQHKMVRAVSDAAPCVWPGRLLPDAAESQQ